MADNTVELQIRAKALLGDAQSQISAFLKELEDKTEKASAKSKGLTDQITGYYKKHKESFEASAKFAALFAGAVVSATAAVVALGVRGSEVDDMKTSFTQLTASVGTFSEVLGALRGATQGVISDFDLMKATNFAFSNGLRLSKDELTDVARAARLLANRVGGDAGQAYETLTRALVTGNEKLLRSAGLTVDADRAVDAFGAKVGKTTEQMSANEVVGAKRNAMLAAMRTELENSAAVEVSFADRLAQIHVQLQNFTDGLGEAIATSPVLKAGMDSLAKSMSDAFGGDQAKAVKQMSGLINDFATGLVTAAQVAVSFAKYVGFAFYGIRSALFFMLSGVVQVVNWITTLQVKAIELQSKIPGIGKVFQAILPAFKEMQAQTEGFAKSFADTSSGAIDDAGNFGAAMDNVNDTLGKAKAAMLAAASAQTEVAETSKKARAGVQDLGDTVVVTAAEMRAFEAQLRSIANNAQQALVNATMSGTQAQLELLRLQTEEQVKQAHENTKTVAMGVQLENDIRAAAAVQRTAILTAEARDADSEIRKTAEGTAQAEIESSQKGLDAKLASLLIQRKAAKDALIERKLSEESTLKFLDSINKDYDAKERIARAENARAIRDDRYNIEKDYASTRLSLLGNSLQASLLANEMELDDRLRTIQLEKNGNKDLIDDTVRLYALKAKVIIAQNDPIFKAWQGLNADMRQTWADTWEQALKGETSFMKAFLKPFTDLKSQLLKILAGILGGIQNQFMAPLNAMLSRAVGNILGKTNGGGFGVPGMGGGFGFGGGGGGSLTSKILGSVFGISGGGGAAAVGGTAAASAASATAAAAAGAVGGPAAAIGASAGVAGSTTAAGGATAAGLGTALASAGILAGVVGVAYLAKHMLTNTTKKARESFALSLGFGGQDGLFAQLRKNVQPKVAEDLINRALNVIGKHDNNANNAWMRDVQLALATGGDPAKMAAYKKGLAQSVAQNAREQAIASGRPRPGIIDMAGSDGGGLYTRPTIRVHAERRPEVAGAPDAIADAFMVAIKKAGGVGGKGGDVHIHAIDVDSWRRFLRKKGGMEEIIETTRTSGAVKVKMNQALTQGT